MSSDSEEQCCCPYLRRKLRRLSICKSTDPEEDRLIKGKGGSDEVQKTRWYGNPLDPTSLKKGPEKEDGATGEGSPKTTNQQLDSAGPSKQNDSKNDEASVSKPKRTEVISFTKFNITEMDGIFEDMTKTLNPFVENREKMEKAEEDFKKAVNSLQKVSPQASFSEYVQALKTKLKKDNIFIKIKNGVVVFVGEVEKAWNAGLELKSAIEDAIEAGKGLKGMPLSIFLASEECLKRCSNIEVTKILKREFTGVLDFLKVWRLKNAFSDNVKKLRQAPAMVRDFYSEARNVIMELFDAFADQEEKERMNEEMPAEEDKKEKKGKGKKGKENKGKGNETKDKGNKDEQGNEETVEKEEQNENGSEQTGEKETMDKNGTQQKGGRAEGGKDKTDQKGNGKSKQQFHKKLTVDNIGIPDIDNIFQDFVKAVNPFVISREQLQTARESFETAMETIASFEVGKALKEYLKELKDKAKKGDIHIYIDVNDDEIKVKSISGVPPPKEYRDAAKALTDMKKAAADLKKLEPDVQRGVEAAIQDVTQVRPQSDFRKMIKIRELPKLPGKIKAFNDNRKKVQQAPTIVKEFVDYVKELLSDIKEFFSEEDKKPEETGPNELTGSKNSEESGITTKESSEKHKIKDRGTNDQGTAGGDHVKSDEDSYKDAKSGQSDPPLVQVTGLMKSDHENVEA